MPGASLPFKLLLMLAVTISPVLCNSQIAFGELYKTYTKSGIQVQYPSDWPYQEGNVSHLVVFYPLEAVLHNSTKPAVYVSVGCDSLPFHNLAVNDYATLVTHERGYQVTENQSSYIPVETITTPLSKSISSLSKSITQTSSALRSIIPSLDNKSMSFYIFKSNLLPSLLKSILGNSNTTLRSVTNITNNTNKPNAYEIVYNSGNLKTMERLTEIDDELACNIAYASPASQYASYLQTARTMFKSFTINTTILDLVKACRFIKANPSILNYAAGTGQVGSAFALGASIATLTC